MSFRTVLVVSDSPLVGDLGRFVGQYGYTQFYGPIPASQVNHKLISMLPGVDIFWMRTTNLSAPVYFTEFKSADYGLRQMWVVEPELEWSLPTELTSLIGSYLSPRRAPEIAETMPELAEPLLLDLRRRYRKQWDRLRSLKDYDEKDMGSIYDFAALHPDPDSAYEAMETYWRIMSGPDHRTWFLGEYERIRKEKGFNLDDMNEDRDEEIMGELRDAVYPADWHLLGQALPLDKIRGILLHLFPWSENNPEVTDFKSPIFYPIIERGGPIRDRETVVLDLQHPYAYRMLQGALDSDNPRPEVVSYLFRQEIAMAPAIIIHAIARGHTEIAEQLLQTPTYTRFESSPRPWKDVSWNNMYDIFTLAFRQSPLDKVNKGKLLRWMVEMGWRPRKEDVSPEYLGLLSEYVAAAGPPKLGQHVVYRA